MYTRMIVTAGGEKEVYTNLGVKKLTELKCLGKSNSTVAKEMGLSLRSVHTKVASLGLSQKPTSGWTDERVDTLKKLWSEGLSASQIACRLGGITRNAVIGKVHRLGLSGRVTTSRKRYDRAKSRAAPVARAKPRAEGNPIVRALMAVPCEVTVEELEIPAADRKQLCDLEECDCRWPIGDPLEANFHFCGKRKVNGLPYCEFHARKAFSVAPSKSKAPTFTTGVSMMSKVLTTEECLV